MGGNISPDSDCKVLWRSRQAHHVNLQRTGCVQGLGALDNCLTSSHDIIHQQQAAARDP